MNKKCVYTAIIGGYDTLKTPLVITEGWDYICYTDSKELKSDNWDIIHVDPYKDAKLLARSIKIQFHEYVSHDISVWIDGSIQIRCNLDEFIKDKIEHVPMSLMQHPHRNNIKSEADECIYQQKDSKEKINKQVKGYEDNGYGFDNGLVATGLIIRKNTREVMNFCDEWLNEVETHSIRDQLSFNYVMWKHQIPHSLFKYSVIEDQNKFIISMHTRNK